MVQETEETQAHVDAESPNQHEVKHEVTKVDNNHGQPVINGGLNTINFFDNKQLVAAENFLTKVMRSEKGGIKSVNDGLAVLMRAQDLGLPLVHVLNIFMLSMVKLELIFMLLKHYYRGQE